jgi:hypothetical protein
MSNMKRLLLIGNHKKDTKPSHFVHVTLLSDDVTLSRGHRVEAAGTVPFSTRCEKATSRRGGRGSPSRAAKCPWSGISTGQAQTANRKSRVRQPAAFPHLWSLRLSLDSGPFGPQRLTGTLVVL